MPKVSKKPKKSTNAVSLLVNAEKIAKNNQVRVEKKYKTITIQRFVKVGREYVYVLIGDDNVRQFLRDVTNLQIAYNKIPQISPNDLIPSMEKIKEFYKDGHLYLKELDSFLDYQLKDIVTACKELVAKNVITFDNLWYILPKETEVVYTENQELCAGVIKNFEYGNGWAGPFVQVTLERVTTNGQTFSLISPKIKIRGFSGLLPINELPMRPLDAETKAKLVERGRTFAKYGVGTHYVQYGGHLKIDSWFGPRFFRSEGRVMIDAISHDKRDSDRSPRCVDDENRGNLDEIPESKLAFHDPYLKGFSFGLKKWGGLAVSEMSEIKFNEKAFETLVLDPEKKKIISALVKNVGAGFKDIIQGKSGGLIFSLMGTPGTGKTLTAEAIAETMKRPLYSVSVGELGVNPAELETKLREILDISSTWNAVVLIDEADIFLEKRTENDIIRNAMVGIFLRLLEYHDGVLFLTTNRIKNFDEAFHSRISVSLHYKPHGKDGLRKIWTNLLSVAGLNGINIDKLLEYTMNGRQIKTSIRLAQALAAEEKKPLSLSHILRTIPLQYEYSEDVSKKGK